MNDPAVLTDPVSPHLRELVEPDEPSSSMQATSLLLNGDTVQPQVTTLQKGFTADTSNPEQTDYLLRRNIKQTSPQSNEHGNPEPFSSSDQIMQRVVTHQGLERVLSIYSNLSGIVRRVAGTLAITQKSR